MKWIICVLAVLLLSYQVEALPHEGRDQLVGHDKATDPDPNSLPPLTPIPDPQTNELLPGFPSNTRVPTPFGIAYAPYNGDGTCRSRDGIFEDMEKMNNHGYVRIYGVDCDQTRHVVDAARQYGMKVFAGVYDLQDFPDSLDLIINAASGDWSVIHSVSIGNELVNKGQNPQDVVDAVHTARAKLRAAGYQGPVVIVDTFSILLRHPELCEASDFCAANCHAFFDANQVPENAGNYVLQQANRISAAADGKRTMITESGWPHSGQANGNAVPSTPNQLKALWSLYDAFWQRQDDLILFSSFDDMWKTDGPGTYGAEKFWGILFRG
ncbi:putative cell wall glucanase (Scw4) [Aspergillus alliaceus]|uniref:putative cell wall glucanase (Scw4) n=1 Tax=Petromyces alliaceus TaxID=209559 RepID=UPI0012A6312F|nr:glycoside hydrolase superfamily [Aspergillus alliaceus]KAB8234065.1 glycoside hydrolase superfamily [Aspergillus alliaceus]